ncbi:MAG: hypothetical protein IT423_01180 [Pirellulaceae bacterium]|nr:hypothetical protein [Pirellulaceae bacterium]
MSSRKSKNNKNQLRKQLKKRLEKKGQAATVIAKPMRVEALFIKPAPSPDEPAVDVAIFNPSVAATLSSTGQSECGLIQQALALLERGEFGSALNGISVIPRSSPYAEWRLFIRGLAAFYQRDQATAQANWSRLDIGRRPARIAKALWLAESTSAGVSNASQTASTIASPTSSSPESSATIAPSTIAASTDTLLPGLKVKDLIVQRARQMNQRPAVLTSVEKILKCRHRDPEVRFSVLQASMLRSLLDDYRKFDGHFISQFAQACARLAADEAEQETFRALRTLQRGPAFDPSWTLHELYRQLLSDENDETEASLRKYINEELPKITSIIKPVQKALTSNLLCILGRTLMPAEGGWFANYFRKAGDLTAAVKLFQEAIKAYPKNRRAHELLLSTYERALADHTLSKAAKDRLIKASWAAKRNFVDNLPDDAEITLELIDYYFHDNKLDDVKKLVATLVDQRLDSPLAKALPWKVKLREVLHQSRLKSALASLDQPLNEAIKAWPIWLPKTWVRFLQAALKLRQGDRAGFEQIDAAARLDAQVSDTVGDFMTFAALQVMNLPAAELKVFRTKVDGHLAKVSAITTVDLMGIASFMWDLKRVGLEHKAYRLQANKLGKELCERLRNEPNAEMQPLAARAFDWVASHGFWTNAYQPPSWCRRMADTCPQASAAYLNCLLKNNAFYLRDLESLILAVRQQADRELDAYYRFRYDQIATTAKKLHDEMLARSSQRKSTGWSAAADMDDDDEDFDDEDFDDDDDFLDAQCDCVNCRAKRAAAEAEQARSKSREKSTANSSAGMPGRSRASDAPAAGPTAPSPTAPSPKAPSPSSSSRPAPGSSFISAEEEKELARMKQELAKLSPNELAAAFQELLGMMASQMDPSLMHIQDEMAHLDPELLEQIAALASGVDPASLFGSLDVDQRAASNQDPANQKSGHAPNHHKPT